MKFCWLKKLQKLEMQFSQTATRKRMQNQNQFLAQAQEEKRDAILNEVMPLIQNGNDPSKIRANVLDKKSDGSVIVQLTPSLKRKPKDRKNKKEMTLESNRSGKVRFSPVKSDSNWLEQIQTS